MSAGLLCCWAPVWVGGGKGKVVGGHRGLLFCVQSFGALQAVVVWAYMGPHAVSEVC